MDYPPTEYKQRPRGIGRWRCGACLFELPEYISTLIDTDFPFEEIFIPNGADRRCNLVDKWAFHSSKERGCKICRSIVSICELSRDRITPPVLKWRRGILDLPDNRKYQIFLIDGQALTPENLAKFHPYVDISEFPSGDTRSSLALGRVASWLRRCVNHHEACAQRSGDITMPQRIIFIDDYTTSSARLIDDTRQMTPQPYLCLSHRWTTQTRASSLTRDRAESFQKAIPKELLSPLLVDAFEITQRLGYRFIWIDCLCIYQDDLNDWHRQASEMAAIYENSDITISAVNAELNDGRIFSRKTPGARKLFTYDGKEVFIRRVDDLHPFIVDYNIFDKSYSTTTNPEHSPLLRRGWVYQEWMLSRRIIYFTSDELILECRQSLQCECGSEKEAWTELKARSATVSEMNWLDICLHHSRTELSYLSDRLPALSGIARRFGEARGWTYLAGLWREDPNLVRQLIWSATTPTPRPGGDGRLPSWSWASVNSPIAVATLPLGEAENITMCVVDHDVLYGLNPYGTPKSAKLVVEGPCVPATLEYIPPGSGPLSKGAFYLFLSLAELIAFVDPDYSFNKPGEGHVASGERVALLVCLFSGTTIQGMVLKSVDASGEAFERIGFAACSFTVSPQRTPERIQSRWTIRRITLI